jgi:hypothetical protein
VWNLFVEESLLPVIRAEQRHNLLIFSQGQIMIIEDLQHRFQELGERIGLVRSYL